MTQMTPSLRSLTPQTVSKHSTTDMPVNNGSGAAMSELGRFVAEVGWIDGPGGGDF